MENEDFETITAEELENWCKGSICDLSKDRLLGLLTGEYDLKEAREDILSFRKPK